MRRNSIRRLGRLFAVAPLALLFGVPLGSSAHAATCNPNITSGPGVDTTTIIQQTAQDCPAGTTINIGAGIYRISSPILPKDGQTFVGAGRGQTQITGADYIPASGWTKDGSAQRWYANVSLDGTAEDLRCY